MNFLFIHLGEKRGGALVYVYVLSALTIESLDGYLPNLVGIKYSWPPAHLYWLSGKIRQRADPGQGHDLSMRGLLQRTSSSELEGYSNKPNV